MKRYLAFLSYRHREPDQQVSSVLLRGLEGYHLPKASGLPARRRVFRDTDELPTGTDLGANIEGALDESEWLIALCSKEYLASQWCLLEIERFIKMGRKDRILPVLLSGTPETAVPEEVRDLPLAADLRGEDLSYDRKKLHGAVPALLTRMEMQQLQPEDYAAAERGFRLRMISGAAAFVLAGILGFAAYAMHTANLIEQGNLRIAEATELTEKARAAAEEERNEALLKNAQYVAGESVKAHRAGEDKEAIRLALSVLPEAPDAGVPLSEDALGALRIAMSIPHDTYCLKTSAETGFEIEGYQILAAPGRFLLFGEEYTEEETVFDLAALEIKTGINTARQQALEKGYSFVCEMADFTKSPTYMERYCLGSEKQMEKINQRGESLPLTLGGEPFYADRMVQSLDMDLIAAWTEHPAEGQAAHLALFSKDQAEAIAEIPVSGVPLRVEFSGDYPYHKELAVLDQEGRLSLFDTKTGGLKKELPGRWRDIHYPYEQYSICVSSAEGNGWSRLNTSDGKEILTVETPSPVRSMLFCPNRSALLTLCDDGVRIYDLKTGKLLNTLFSGEVPRFAFWGGMSSGKQSFSGNMIVLLFDRRVEVWTLDTSADPSGTGIIRLYEEGLYNHCEFAFYSLDGKTLYLEMLDGTLSAWDAGTGRFLWADPGDWNTSGAHIPSVLSEDGTHIWRRNEGLEWVDAVTGEIRFRLNSGGNGRTPVESPDHTLAVQPGISWSGMKGLDLMTGELLWKDDSKSGQYGHLSFSEDGSFLFSWSLERSSAEYADDLVYRRRDPRTGNILEERSILHLTGIQADRIWELKLLKEEGVALVYKSYAAAVPGSKQTDNMVYIISLQTGEVLAEVTPPVPGASLRVSSDGGAAFGWKADNSLETAWVCRLEEDGTLGETLSAYSEEGRRILAGKTQLVCYNGEEAVLDAVQYDPDELYPTAYQTAAQSNGPKRLKRLSDNALLLDAGDAMIAAPEQGESVCIYSKTMTPVLFLSSDPEELIRKARKYMEELP